MNTSQPLSQDQLNAMTSAGNGVSPTQAPTDALSKVQLDAMVNAGLNSSQSAAVLGHSTGLLNKNIGNIYQNSISNPQNSGQNLLDMGIGAVKSVGDTAVGAARLGENVANQTAGRMVNAVQGKGFTPLSGQQLGNDIANPQSPVSQTVDSSLAAKNDVQGVGKFMGNAAQAAIPVGDVAKGGIAAESIVGKGLQAVKSGITQLGDMTGVTKFLADRADKKALQSTLDAVYSSPTGKKFTQSASQIISGQREITPSSIFKEQGITPDQQTINLANRLKDVGLGKDPVKNTQILANEMTNTESKLQTALKGDPNVQYSADKPKLFQALDAVKTNAPEEFRIKDSQTMVNKVVDFANKLAKSAQDTIGGLRDGRIAFDTQAKREFPSAFKPDGTIDTKTPAGYAIKTVRDSWNEHLYNTAPNGSDIQSLIGHEADLYLANQTAVEKAAAGQGKKSLQQWAEANPKKATTAIGLLGIGGYNEAKKIPLVRGLLP